MEQIIEIFKINWVHQLIGVALFAIGTLLGAIAIMIIWKRFTLRKRGEDKTVKDVSHLTQNALTAYEEADSKIEIKKITYICEALTYLLDAIPLEYGNTKAYDVIAKEDVKVKGKEVLLSDLSVHLDFTVYELLGFINSLAEQIRGEIHLLLNSSEGKLVWFVGKLALRSKIQADDRRKDLDEITVESLWNVVLSLLEKDGIAEEKQDGKVKSFFKFLAGKAKDIAISNVALPVGNYYIDKYVKDIIVIFAEELNKLYSKQYKVNSVKSVSQPVVEEGV